MKSFFLNDPKMLIYGFMIIFFGSYGQTFFIALFNDDIKKSFKTIFNYLPNSVSIFNEITSGLNARNDLTSNSKIFYKLLSHFFGSSLIDKIAFKKLINST